MAEDTVDIAFSHPWRDHEVHDRVSVHPDEARRLIGAGIAVPATKPEAKKVGADPDTAASAKK